MAEKTGDRKAEILQSLAQMLENLRTAACPGMKTVWVTLARRAPAYVDIKIANLMQLPRLLSYLQ